MFRGEIGGADRTSRSCRLPIASLEPAQPCSHATAVPLPTGSTSVQTEPTARPRAAARNSPVTLLPGLTLGLAAAIVVAAIDWGGVDHTASTRALAGVWTFLAVQSLAAGWVSRRSRAPKRLVVGGLYGAVGAACMVPGQLANGWVAAGFVVAAAGFLIANLVEVHRFRREIKGGI